MAGWQDRQLSHAQVTVKTVLVVCATALAFFVGVKLVAAARYSLLIVIGSVLLAVALHHGVDFLEAHRWKRKRAMVAVIAGFMAVLVGVLLLLVPPAVRQARELSNHAPELIEKVRGSSAYQQINSKIPIDQELEKARGQEAKKMVQPAMKAVSTALQLLGAVVAIIATSFFVLIFGGPLVRRWLAEAMPESRERYERVLHKTYGSVGGYMTGLGMICGANAVCTTTFLAILRIPFFIPLGLLSGLSSMIPLVGNTLMGILITLIALVAGGAKQAIAVGVFYLVYQQFENHVLGPLIYKKTVQVNPLVNVVTLLIMSEVLGVPGAILAVPAVASLQIVIREVLLYRREALNAPRNGPLSEPVPQRELEREAPRVDA